MDINSAEEFMQKLIEKAAAYGFEDAEAAYSSSGSMSLSILNGEVSSYENSTEQEITFRGYKNGQMGYSSTGCFDDDAVRFMLEAALENCEVLDDEDREFIYCDENHKIMKFSQITEAYKNNTYGSFKKLGLEIEAAILALDKRIDAVDYLELSCSTGPVMIINSKGLHLYRDSDSVFIVAQARATDDDGSVKSGGHYWFGNDISMFDLQSFMKVFAHKILDKLGAKSCSSGCYRTIIEAEAFVQLLSTFFGVFSSNAMQKGLSLLKGREGEKISSECLTIKEVPMYDKALVKVPFDDEGVLTTEKNIIGKGIFETALYNLKTAYKEGRASTGNGFKNGNSTGITYTNLLVEPGASSLEELAAEAGDGIMITDLSGLHAGANTISGDFSLLCEGFLIKNGKISSPVEQITVSDNFYDILLKIISVGNDIINSPDALGETFVPSVLVSEMSISGES